MELKGIDMYCPKCGTYLGTACHPLPIPPYCRGCGVKLRHPAMLEKYYPNTMAVIAKPYKP